MGKEHVCAHAKHVCMHAKSVQSRPTLCNPMDCSLPGSSVHGIIQARILEGVAMSSSKGSVWPRDQTHVSYVSCIGRQVLYHERHLGSPEFNSIQFNTSITARIKSSCLQ